MAKKPKYDHLRQMGGRTMSGERRSSRARRNVDSFRRHVRDLTPQQNNILDMYVAQERNLYNELLDTLYARRRSTPEFYKQLTDKHIQLFGKLIRITFDIRTLANKKSEDTELPKLLEPYRDILFGIHGEKEEGLSEQFKVFYEICCNAAMVIPDTRENMARAFIDFFLNDLGSLASVNMMQKRHLQIRKEQIRHEWDEAEFVTKLYLPHFERPLLVETDLGEYPTSSQERQGDNPDWNLMILHRDPNDLLAGANVPWVIDFKYLNNSRYMLKYLESVNPESQMTSRFLK